MKKLIVLDGKFDITKLEFEPLSVFSKDNLSKLDNTLMLLLRL